MISQEKRFRSAIEALRPVLRIAIGATTLRTLTLKERQAFADRIMAHQWFRRTFTVQRARFRPTWAGSQLDVLHELSHYLVPRELWATPRSKGEAWVRRETCYSFVALMQHVYGAEIAKIVRAELVKQGVKYRPKRVLTGAQKAALAKQAKERFGKKKEKEVSDGLVEMMRERIAIIRGAGGPIPVTIRKVTPPKPVTTVPGRRRINFDD
jgi:hypothetical protein